MKPSKEYIGDAVYAESDDFGRVTLTTEDGICVSNTIVLELDVIRALERYLDRMKQAQAIAAAKRRQAEEEGEQKC